MILWLVFASLAFGFTVTLLDKPSIPAWQGKYAYRAIASGGGLKVLPKLSSPVARRPAG